MRSIADGVSVNLSKLRMLDFNTLPFGSLNHKKKVMFTPPDTKECGGFFVLC